LEIFRRECLDIRRDWLRSRLKEADSTESGDISSWALRGETLSTLTGVRFRFTAGDATGLHASVWHSLSDEAGLESI
jgi:hypothetical protein